MLHLKESIHMAKLHRSTRSIVFTLLTWLLVALHVSTFTVGSQYAAPGTAAWTLATTATCKRLLPVAGADARTSGSWSDRALRPPAQPPPRFITDRFDRPHARAALRRPDDPLMYGFHINGFVLDLVLTPGGIASLGANLSTQITAALIVAALLLMQAAAYYLTAVRQAAPMKRTERRQALALAHPCPRLRHRRRARRGVRL